MSLILLLCNPALADRVFWVAPLSAEDQAALQRTLPDAISSDISLLQSKGVVLPPADVGALSRLDAELTAVRPLLEEFDGELQIMARLSKAIDDVHILRNVEDRDLYWRALLFTGFAVDRYYQDKLGTDPGAAPYRSGSGVDARINAWLEATSLLGTGVPTPEQLPEATQRRSFDNLQAYVRAMPSSAFVVGQLASGAEVRVDGVKIEPIVGTRVNVTPGHHFWQVRVGDTELIREDRDIASAADIRLDAPIGPVELEVLRQLSQNPQDGWTLPMAANMAVHQIGEPVYIAIPGEELRLLRIDQGRAQNVPIVKEFNRWLLRATIGMGWSSSGDWLLLHPEAPNDKSTVNAATPVFSVGMEFHPIRQLAFGLAVDGNFPSGQWHTLTSNETEVRTLLYPHVEAGLPILRLCAGPLFPWYVGLGLRGNVPLFGPLEATAGATWGLPLERPYEDGTSFQPLPLWSAWGGLSARLAF